MFHSLLTEDRYNVTYLDKGENLTQLPLLTFDKARQTVSELCPRKGGATL